MIKTFAATALVGALLGACVAGPACAQADANPAAVHGGAFRVEPAHTQIVFSVKHLGFTYFSGMFSGAAGELRLDPANPGGSMIDVTVPVASIVTTVPKLDAELKGPQWFDAARFPTATFKSTKVTSTGEGAATIEGELTLHGVTRAVSLTARFVGAGINGVNPLSRHYTVGFEATGTIRRSEFGVSTAIPFVGDEVRLSIAGAFEAQ
jgi:polyisoprenoid-binding protein YceI